MKWNRYGQHFLIDQNIIQKEITEASITKDDVVLEIGPGKGALTKELSKHAKQVIAIEIDQKLCDLLSNNIPSNVTLLCKDVMKVDFTTIPKFTKVVANLPYQISSPITFKLLQHSFEKAVLIYQKEFAERMVAKSSSKKYGRLSVNVYYKARCRLIQTISKHCFSPKPKVDSAMIELIPRNKPAFNVKNEQLFYQLTNILFSHRRKKIKNIIQNQFNIKEANFSYADMRVEKLEPEEIGNLSDELAFLLSR